MSTITINGKTYSGNSIIVTNGNVFVDGKEVTPDSKIININVDGDITELKVDVCDIVSVNGTVSNIKTVSGDVEVTGNLNGSINTVSGYVVCGNVGGSVSTVSGDIKHNKNTAEKNGYLFTYNDLKRAFEDGRNYTRDAFDEEHWYFNYDDFKDWYDQNYFNF